MKTKDVVISKKSDLKKGMEITIHSKPISYATHKFITVENPLELKYPMTGLVLDIEDHGSKVSCVAVFIDKKIYGYSDRSLFNVRVTTPKEVSTIEYLSQFKKDDYVVKLSRNLFGGCLVEQQIAKLSRDIVERNDVKLSIYRDRNGIPNGWSACNTEEVNTGIEYDLLYNNLELRHATKEEIEAYEQKYTPKPKFKVGDWVYRDIDNRVFRVHKTYDNGYYLPLDYCTNTCHSIRLATDEQILSRLIQLAKDKGFVSGAKFKRIHDKYVSNCDGKFGTWECTAKSYSSMFCIAGKNLVSDGNEIYHFDTDTWAEIVETKKTIFGYEVKDISLCKVKIGCQEVGKDSITEVLTALKQGGKEISFNGVTEQIDEILEMIK